MDRQRLRMRRRVTAAAARPAAWLALAAAACSVAVKDAKASSQHQVRRAGLPLCAGGGETSGLVSAWRMGAVHFFSPSVGVGLTAGALMCTKHSNAATEVTLRPQPVLVALTSDGGHHWRLRGTAAPVGAAHPATAGEQMVADSSKRIWAIAGDAQLLQTENGGRTWSQAPLPGPAVALAAGRADIWALTCLPAASRTSPEACRPRLWRAPIRTGRWARVAIPRLIAQDPGDVHLAVASEQSVLLSIAVAAASTRGELAISTNAGASWRTRTDPRWDGRTCPLGGSITAAPPRTFWLLCIGAAAAGSSTKGLLRSQNAGRTWTTVSAVTDLLVPSAPTSLPVAEPSALAAGSAVRIWLSTTNGLSESNDAGRAWSRVRSVFNPGGWPTTIYTLDATHAWLLAPGAGLWSTTDGSHWKAIGPLNGS